MFKIKITPHIYLIQTIISRIAIYLLEDGIIMDIISLIIGFAIGVVVVGIAVEIGMKKMSPVKPASKYTKKWNISEISNPRIMAEYLGNIELPKNSKIIVNRFKDEGILAGLDVKKHSGIKGNYVIGDDRALILAGPVKKDEMGFWTVEKEILEKLNNEFEEMWTIGKQMKQEEK
jgi:hypothetical protein